MSEDQEREEDFAEDAADATEESRREAAEEGKTLEDQADTLAIDEGEEEIRPY